MNERSIKWLLMLGFLQAVSLFAKQQEQKPAVQQQLALVRPPKHAHDYSDMLVGAYAQFRGDPSKALEYMKKCLSYSHSPYAHGSYLHLLQSLGQQDRLVNHYEQHNLQQVFGHDVATQLAVAQGYLALNNHAKAEELFIRLGQLHPDNEQIAYFATMALLKTNQLDKANGFIEVCLKKPLLKQKHFLFHFLQSKIFFERKNMDAALASIEQSLALSPKFPQALLFRAMLMEQRRDLGNAIKGYEGFVHATKHDESIEKHIVQLLFDKGDYVQAIKRLEKFDAKTPDYFYDLALLHFHNKAYVKALALVEQSLALQPALLSGMLLKIKLLATMKKTPDLVAFVQKLLIEQPSNMQILYAFQLLKSMGLPLKKLIEMGCAALKEHKTARLMAVVADLCVEAKEVALADKIYGAIIKHSKNPQVRARARYQICYAFFAAGYDTLLEKRLEEVITDQAVDPASYNLFAYHYATHGKKLDQALVYADKALAMRPDYPPYQDTKAYVLIKMGDKDKGLALLRNAHAKDPGDRIIAARLLALESGLWQS